MAHHDRRATEVDDVAVAVHSAGKALQTASDHLERARTQLQTALAAAAAGGYSVTDSGAVSPPPLPAEPAGPTGHAQTVWRREADGTADHQAGVASRLGGQIDAALTAADAADSTASAVLSGLTLPVISPPPTTADLTGLLAGAAGGAGAGSGLALILDPSTPGSAAGAGGTGSPAVPTSPTEAAAWWKALSAADRAALLAEHPEQLGRQDGLPAAVRHTANMAALAALRPGLQAEADRLRWADVPLHTGNPYADHVVRRNYDRWRHAQDRLDALTAIQDTAEQPNRQLLAFDFTGRETTAVVANGDVDTAAHVAVFTPGFTTTVQGALTKYDDSLNLLKQRATGLAGQTLLPGSAATTGTVATVAWLGYQAPQMDGVLSPSRSVGASGAAHRGAERLDRFLTGLDAARPVPAHITALGHSYGSTTTGLALQRNDVPDDAVVFGSPGLGTEDVHDLNLQPGRMYAIDAGNDLTADLGRFGDDPDQMPGITRLDAAARCIDGQQLQRSSGHSEYLQDGTTSQYAMAAVVAGRPEFAPVHVPPPPPPPWPPPGWNGINGLAPVEPMIEIPEPPCTP